MFLESNFRDTQQLLYISLFTILIFKLNNAVRQRSALKILPARRFTCPSDRLLACLLACLPPSLSACLLACSPACLPVCLPVSLLSCLSVGLPARLLAHLLVCLSVC